MNPIVIRILERHRNLLLMSAAMLCGGVAIYAGSRYVNEQVQAERERLAPVAQQMVVMHVADPQAAQRLDEVVVLVVQTVGQ